MNITLLFFALSFSQQPSELYILIRPVPVSVDICIYSVGSIHLEKISAVNNAQWTIVKVSMVIVHTRRRLLLSHPAFPQQRRKFTSVAKEGCLSVRIKLILILCDRRAPCKWSFATSWHSVKFSRMLFILVIARFIRSSECCYLLIRLTKLCCMSGHICMAFKG